MTTRTILCREGWYYCGVLLIMFLGALIREVNPMLLLAALMCGPLLLSWRMAVTSLRGLRITRKMSLTVGADDPWVVQVEIDNPRSYLPGWAVVVEQVIRPLDESNVSGPMQPAVFFPFVGAKSRRNKSFEGRLPHRGCYEVGAPVISTRFPFGLFRREVSEGEPESLIVYPHVGELAPNWRTRQHDAMEASSRHRQRHSRVSGDLYGVRKWGSGDSQRWIHWRASAKHSELMVRQFEQPRNHDAAILLDLWQPDQPTDQQHDHAELAISFMATVLHDISRRGGCNLIVGTSNGSPELEVGPVSTPLLDQVMNQLARMKASPEDHLPELLQMAFEHLDQGAEVIIVSTRPIDLDDEQRFGELWNSSLRRVTSSQLRLVDVSDSAIEQLYRP